MQTLGCVSEQVAVLVDGAALPWHVAPEGGQCLLQPSAAVDDQKLWLAQPALDEIVENGAPCLAGLAAHVLRGQQHFLAVLAHAEHDQEYDRGGLPVEPNSYHGAVQDQADDRLLGQRAGHSRHPNRLSPSATRGSPYLCRPRRQKQPRAPAAPDAYWFRQDRHRQSANRLAWW